jgi:hypothetical protein
MQYIPVIISIYFAIDSCKNVFLFQIIVTLHILIKGVHSKSKTIQYTYFILNKITFQVYSMKDRPKIN